MYTILMSLGDMPAGEGIAGVIGSALLAVGTLTLIYSVLVILDRYHKKHGSDDVPKVPPTNDSSKTFSEVLEDKMKKKEENDRHS